MAERKTYLLRIDPALWAEIERLAQAELRSVNGEVEYLLREALRQRGVLKAGSGVGQAKGKSSADKRR
jgi:hypothetical protein